jgi:uncharacterized membrane protein YedE/YeeE
MNWILEPWPWYISGPLITLTMLALIYAGKSFGMSSNLRTICASLGAGKNCDFFSFDWKTQKWNLLVLLGTIIGGFLALNFLMGEHTSPNLNTETLTQLHSLGFLSAGESYLPQELFSSSTFTSAKGILILLIGGFLVGFGARYAGGCTSGHAISGLSNLQLPSLIAVIGFFVGGLIMIHLIFPLIF